jgi:hypothetical protein
VIKRETILQMESATIGSWLSFKLDQIEILLNKYRKMITEGDIEEDVRQMIVERISEHEQEIGRTTVHKEMFNKVLKDLDKLTE